MENAIRELRAVYGWTQADLAALIGVSRQSVNAIETGKYDPSLPIAFAIGRVFGLPIETIFSDGGDEPPEQQELPEGMLAADASAVGEPSDPSAEDRWDAGPSAEPDPVP
jgi:putative transcriptional regulator